MTDDTVKMGSPGSQEVAEYLEQMASDEMDEPTTLRVVTAMFINDETGEPFVQFYLEHNSVIAQAIVAQQASGTYGLAAYELLQEMLDQRETDD